MVLIVNLTQSVFVNTLLGAGSYEAQPPRERSINALAVLPADIDRTKMAKLHSLSEPFVIVNAMYPVKMPFGANGGFGSEQRPT